MKIAKHSCTAIKILLFFSILWTISCQKSTQELVQSMGHIFCHTLVLPLKFQILLLVGLMYLFALGE